MAALDPIFERHRAQVYAWAYRVVQREHDAQDVAQEVYLRWWQARGQGAALKSPPAWLRRVTINLAIDMLRARRRNVDHGEPETDPGAVPTGAETRERAEQVVAALGRLSDRQRDVVVAKVYDGLTFAAIAGQMALSVPTVKTHYLRGLASLREALGTALIA